MWYLIAWFSMLISVSVGTVSIEAAVLAEGYFPKFIVVDADLDCCNPFCLLLSPIKWVHTGVHEP